MSVVDTAKTAYDLAKKGMTVEFQEKIMQLREEALELQEENLRLKNENRELKERIESRETVKFDRHVYWRNGDPVPYCPLCYEKSQMLLHLNGPSTFGGINNLYSCSGCSTMYREQGDRGFIHWFSKSGR
jgi:hypothetical protein